MKNEEVRIDVKDQDGSVNIVGIDEFLEGIKTFVSDDKIKSYSHDVLFSGGYDSTFILLNLCELKKAGYIENIKVITIDGAGDMAMGKKERDARNNILNRIKEDYNIEIENPELNIKYLASSNSDRKYGFILQHLYVNAGIVCSSEKSILYNGNILEDSDTIRFKYLEDMVSNINKYYTTESDTILCAPLFNTSKVDILYRMKKNFPEYFDLPWTCQSPVEDKKNPDSLQPCMKCVKCISLMRTLNMVKIIQDEKYTLDDLKLIKNEIKKL